MPRLIPKVRGIRKTLSGSSNKSPKSPKSPLKSPKSPLKDKGISQSTVSLTEGDADWIVRKTETRVAETVAKSQYIQKNCKLYKLPRFQHEELELGDLIASGGFCEVREIKSFKTANELDRSCVEPKQYVIKSLAPKLVSKPKQLAIGAKDLVMEGFVLSSLCHENILEVKGFASSGVSGYASTGRIDGFFLVLPRLDKTLHKQLHEWKVAVRRQQKQQQLMLACSSAHSMTGTASCGTEEWSANTTEVGRSVTPPPGAAAASSCCCEEASASEGTTGRGGGCDSDHPSEDEEDDNNFDPEKFPFFGPRIQTAVEIASAIAYCHRNRILYRDLKPANIGYSFDEDRVKLFDFGLAVELPPSNDPNKTFKLPGNTGTARYMAPEVVRAEHYGFKADVFSFCMLLHEIMALVKPFDKLTGKEVKEQVAVLGNRPAIDKTWPVCVRKLLRRGYSEVPEIRPTMEDIQDTLEDLVDSL